MRLPIGIDTGSISVPLFVWAQSILLLCFFVGSYFAVWQVGDSTSCRWGGFETHSLRLNFEIFSFRTWNLTFRSSKALNLSPSRVLVMCLAALHFIFPVYRRKLQNYSDEAELFFDHCLYFHSRYKHVFMVHSLLYWRKTSIVLPIFITAILSSLPTSSNRNAFYFGRLLWTRLKSPLQESLARYPMIPLALLLGMRDQHL